MGYKTVVNPFHLWKRVELINSVLCREKIIKFNVGEFVGPSESSPYEVLVRESTYQKLLTGEYRVLSNSKTLAIFDLKNRIVPARFIPGTSCMIH